MCEVATKQKVRYCAQCRRGYDGSQDEGVGPAEAEYYVVGHHIETKRPYRAYLCDGHVEIIEEEYNLTLFVHLETGRRDQWDSATGKCHEISPVTGSSLWRKQIDDLVRCYTGFRDLEHMTIAHWPTLRLDPYEKGSKQYVEMKRLRDAYRFVTGRDAAT